MRTAARVPGSAAKRPVSAAERPAVAPVRVMPAYVAMQAFGRLPPTLPIPDEGDHFQQVLDNGERCAFFVEERNPQGFCRRWTTSMASANHGSIHGLSYPDTPAAKASHKFANFGAKKKTDDRHVLDRFQKQGNGWMVESPFGEQSIHNKLVYSAMSGAKLLASYAHVKGW
jgi:hypothetical protein